MKWIMAYIMTIVAVSIAYVSFYAPWPVNLALALLIPAYGGLIIAFLRD